MKPSSGEGAASRVRLRVDRDRGAVSSSGEGDLAGEVTAGCALPGPLPCAPLCWPAAAPGVSNLVESPLVPATGWSFGAYARAKLSGALLAGGAGTCETSRP